MTTRTMYDAVTLADVPTRSPQMIGCYRDGAYANVDEARTRFPHARLVVITVTGNTLAAHVVDVERGDCSPEGGAAWAHRKVAAGQHPTIYCNSSTWPAVRSAVHALGLDGRVSYWIAEYDNRAIIPAGAVAKQYIGDHAPGYDESIVAAYWPGVDPAPTPTPTPAPAPTPAPHPTSEVPDVFLIQVPGDASVYATDFASGTKWHVPNPNVLRDVEHVTGRTIQAVSAATRDALRTV